jgi:hypothetical protein
MMDVLPYKHNFFMCCHIVITILTVLFSLIFNLIFNDFISFLSQWSQPAHHTKPGTGTMEQVVVVAIVAVVRMAPELIVASRVAVMVPWVKSDVPSQATTGMGRRPTRTAFHADHIVKIGTVIKVC